MARSANYTKKRIRDRGRKKRGTRKYGQAPIPTWARIPAGMLPALFCFSQGQWGSPTGSTARPRDLSADSVSWQ